MMQMRWTPAGAAVAAWLICGASSLAGFQTATGIGVQQLLPPWPLLLSPRLCCLPLETMAARCREARLEVLIRWFLAARAMRVRRLTTRRMRSTPSAGVPACVTLASSLHLPQAPNLISEESSPGFCVRSSASFALAPRPLLAAAPAAAPARPAELAGTAEPAEAADPWMPAQ